MSGLIITDNSGKILGIHNTQDHHIIHQATEGAKQLFDELGLDIHGKENRITLPADEKLTEHGVTDMTQHVGRHDDIVLKDIQKEVEDIRTSLREGNISREKAKERLLNYIQDQRQGLETGEISLNSVGRKE
jgi:alcohol dehydrogenase YqhD (iron-dependent ADH family)